MIKMMIINLIYLRKDLKENLQHLNIIQQQ